MRIEQTVMLVTNRISARRAAAQLRSAGDHSR
jgi:hypothetical protein